MVVVNEDFELVGNISGSITPFTSKVRLITSKIGGVGAHISNEEMEDYLGYVNEHGSKSKFLTLRNNKIKTRYYAIA